MHPCFVHSVAVRRAQLLLGMKHSIARLDNVWGVGGGQRPVMFLISKVNTVSSLVFCPISIPYCVLPDEPPPQGVLVIQ